MSTSIKVGLVLFILFVGIGITVMMIETGFIWFAIIIFVGYLYLKMGNRDERHLESPEQEDLYNPPFSDYVERIPGSELLNRLKGYEADFRDSMPDGGFDTTGAREYALAICLGEYDPSLKPAVRHAMMQVYAGELTPSSFSSGIHQVVRQSRVDISDWKQGLKLIERQHKPALHHLRESGTAKRVSPQDETEYIYKQKQDDWEWLLDDAELAQNQQSALHDLGPNWLPSALTCEHCKGDLYKMVFPAEKTMAVPIKQEDGSSDEWAVTRVYTCEPCQTFYYSKPGYKLSQAGTSSRALDRKDYTRQLMAISTKGSE